MDVRPLIAVIVALALVWVILNRRKFQRTIVYEWNWGLHYRNGRFRRVLPPGAYRWFLPGNHVELLDKRRRVAVIPGQEILTHDNAPVKISMVAEYRIEDPTAAMNVVSDTNEHLHTRVQVALREAVGKRDLDEILNHRNAIAAEVGDSVTASMKSAGIEISDINLRDIMLGRELREAYAAILTARKEGEAKLEQARSETAALRSLANAARMIKDNPDLMQLRVPQSMSSDGGGKRTFVIGVPSGSLALADDTSDRE